MGKNNNNKKTKKIYLILWNALNVTLQQGFPNWSPWKALLKYWNHKNVESLGIPTLHEQTLINMKNMTLHGQSHPGLK